MLVLIYGGSGSGKSAYAENWVQKHKKRDGKAYYLATMEVYDSEGVRRVEKHRLMRRDKGFITVEHHRHIENILENPITGQDIILLECLSNLVANEIFYFEPSSSEHPEQADDKFEGSMKVMDAETVVKNIMKAIQQIEEKAGSLCIVGNDIFGEGTERTPEMESYLQAMGQLQRQIADRAARVVEVVYGVPIDIRSERHGYSYETDNQYNQFPG